MFLFFPLVSAIRIQLTNENFTSFIAESGKPLFLKLWATWCPHCREIAPTWDELANLSDLSDDVYIADIECESNRVTCNSYPGGTSYPRLYWVDLENRTAVPYTGPRSIDHFISFIKKQLRFPMVLINDTDLQPELSSTNISTVFLFRILEPDADALAVAREVTLAFRTFECRFFIAPAISDRSLTAFTGHNRSIRYSADWTNSSISQFVLLNSLPFLVNVTSYVMRHVTEHRLTLFIAIAPDLGELPESAVRVGDRMSGHFPVAATNCVESSYLCRYVGIGSRLNATTYVIYNRARRLFWVSDAPSEDAAVAWALAVKNGSVAARGSGDGRFGGVLEIYFENRGHGRPIVLIAFGPVVALIALAFLVADCRGIAGDVKAKAD
jgi:thiol-disulfide isomerase/thioredoxin